MISVDAEARTADVQGMCTYEHLVDATLPHGLMPMVVPQLRTITLGGAVTGLGIESSSFRNGLPHESVIEMDILTGDGEIVTARPDGEHADLFAAFPNSYGSLGYAVRLRIELEPVQTYVALRHVRFTDLDELAAAVATICAERSWDGEDVDFLDGVMFSVDEAYLTLGRWTDDIASSGLLAPSDYTGQQIYYRSLRERSRDVLTAYDYLWRWDTDWFWCSGAFGAQNPRVRKVWPRKWRRSDVYYKIVGLENRFQVKSRIDRARGDLPKERVVQDIEVPVERDRRLPALVRGRGRDDAGVAVPAQAPRADRSRSAHARGRCIRSSAGQPYVNVGFWGLVPIQPGRADGDVNRMIEQAVADHGGHKSLYSDAYYDEDEFAAMYGGQTYEQVKKRYDPDHRLTGLYEKAVGRR